MFSPLPEKFTYPQIEKLVLENWDKEKIVEKSLVDNKDKKYFTFYDGPPTVNGNPGIHHVLSRTIKDAVCRYKTMSGYYVRRQAGWDTHGLPVEIQVEKDLGLKDKTEIVSYGIDKFNKACREFVFKNIESDIGWRTLTRRMGYWVDMDSPYITCTNDYIESVWWALKQFFDKGYIYKGFKVVPQSPTIGTPLSSHELALGYKDVKDPNCYIMLNVTQTNEPLLNDCKILVWTTTPWTLLGNVALAVGEDIDYVVVENTRKNKETTSTDKLVLAKERLSALDGEYQIIAELKGSQIVGTHYEPIFEFNTADKNEFPKAYSVIAGDFVTTSNGSGIVHLAPAFVEDDYRMSRVHNLPFIQHVTPNGHVKEGYGDFTGRAVKNLQYEDRKEEGVDKDVVITLKYKNKIYRSTNDYLHSYPHCWRTGNPIIYYARESWFIKSPEYKERMVELNNTINWQPPEIGAGRFGNWLDEVKEWNLSRDRYWGTPLPIWVNENDEQDLMAVGSIEELKKGFIEDENGNLQSVSQFESEIDLHRPFVDNVIFVENGQKYRRVSEVIDVWFDSGAMPFAQLHYPFENKEVFEQNFPADFIAEGIDQTRGWFYTLHNISTAIFDKPAFKNIVVNDMVLDENGLKMSKSKGNTVDPFKVMDELGADAVRWYFFVNNPPWRPTSFNQKDIAKIVISDFFRSLTNTYAFFALYANIDKFDCSEELVPISQRPVIDKWLISKLNTLIKDYTEMMDNYELTKAHRAIQAFTIDFLSNWYIRRNRRRFWKGENDKDKIAAYQTLHQVLLALTQLSASTAPFLSDYLYTKLKTDDMPESVHLTLLPKADLSLIDVELEERMSLATDIVFVARSLREKAKIRTRQPLNKILIPVSNPHERRQIQAVEEIIKEEINIKFIEFVTDDSSTIVRKKAKANFKVIGKKFGKNTNTVAEIIKNFSSDDISKLEKGNTKQLTLDNGDYIEINNEDVEIVAEEMEGWLVDSYNGITVALDIHLDQELLNEGIAREFVNRLQNMRKEHGYEVTDRIDISYYAEGDTKAAIAKMADYISSETLAESINHVDEVGELTKLDIEELDIFVKIVKK